MAKKKQLDLSNPRALRNDRGENQATFWGRFGVTQSGGSRFETSRPIPRPVQKLMRLFFTGQLTDDQLLDA